MPDDNGAVDEIVNAHLGNSIAEQGMLKEPNALGYEVITAEVELPLTPETQKPQRER